MSENINEKIQARKNRLAKLAEMKDDQSDSLSRSRSREKKENDKQSK